MPNDPEMNGNTFDLELAKVPPDVISLHAVIIVELHGALRLVTATDFDSYVYGRARAYEFVLVCMTNRWPVLATVRRQMEERL